MVSLRATMRTALILFAAGLALRALPWLASPERALPFSAAYRGDADNWWQLLQGRAGLEAILPFRPPGMAWFVQATSTAGGDALLARLCIVVLGAAIPPLVYLALRRSFAHAVAAMAGWICALSGSLIVLGSGLHGEIPYLLLFVLTMPDFERLRQQPAPAGAGAVAAGAMAPVRWSLLHAAACLFRADHLLCWAAMILWLAWQRRAGPRRDLLLATATFVLALLPWQLHAAGTVADYNRAGLGEGAPQLPLPGSLPWDDDALAKAAAMPAFARANNFRFVDATVRVRGGARVHADDLRILDEAFGYTPEPIGMPILAIYGPLNFFLANSPESAGAGGFTRAPLDRLPPLASDPERYPPGVLAGLPAGGALELSYPPHLRALNHGYRLGLGWIAAHPLAAAALVGSKLAQAWRGAATGLGAHRLPLGRSGVRQPVDLVVAEGWLATGWRLMLLAAAAAGAFASRRHPAAAGWTIWLLAKLAITAAFFGYARLGALCVPTLALYWALVLAPHWGRLPPRWRRAGAAALVLALATVELFGGCGQVPRVTGPAPGSEDARAHVRYP
jgi:hypothetical protein